MTVSVNIGGSYALDVEFHRVIIRRLINFTRSRWTTLSLLGLGLIGNCYFPAEPFSLYHLNIVLKG